MFNAALVLCLNVFFIFWGTFVAALIDRRGFNKKLMLIFVTDFTLVIILSALSEYYYYKSFKFPIALIWLHGLVHGIKML